MRRVAKVVTSAANPTSPLADTWVSVADSPGLKALGVPPETLEFLGNSGRGGGARERLRATPGRARCEHLEKPGDE